jgi:hypothetical protein
MDSGSEEYDENKVSSFLYRSSKSMVIFLSLDGPANIWIEPPSLTLNIAKSTVSGIVIVSTAASNPPGVNLRIFSLTLSIFEFTVRSAPKFLAISSLASLISTAAILTSLVR